MEKADLFLEVGSEEIPAGYIGPAAQALARRITDWLRERELDFDESSVRVFSTPRRIAIRVEGVGLAQPSKTEQRLGPAVAAAFDNEGIPTKAAEGFARGAGITVDELERVETDRGERVAASVRTGGVSTTELLGAEGLLREWMQLPFPKTMRWIPGSDLRYARPIRWIVFLLGDDVVEARLEHLVAGRHSRGHRTLAPGAVEIARPTEYEETLARVHVRVSPEERRVQIEGEARRVAEEAGGSLHEDPDLLDEIVQLAEHPLALRGGFDPALIDVLPKEVIITAMRSHQRYFSVVSKGGRLLPSFITFRDGDEVGLENVVEGNERVLRARLEDALFYWNEDRSRDSDEKLEALERVVWLEGYGSVADKCRRLEALAMELAGALELNVSPAPLRRAALLCKSDLATEMIRDGKEFTKLQGLMGRYYALEAGEEPAVADAIAEHLHPRHANDRLPEGDLATLVALSDRLDSIAGSILAGFAPTGSQDPYALRRQSLAVLRILLERGFSLDVEGWCRRALQGFESEGAARDEALAQCLDLFWGRLETILSELPVEIVRGVLTVHSLDPVDNVRAARDLAGLAGSDAFQSLLAGAKRCRNILAKENRLDEETEDGPRRSQRLRETADGRWSAWVRHRKADEAMGFDSRTFQDEAEIELHRQVVDAVSDLEHARESGDHAAAYERLAGLGPAIDAYFDEVLVNADDPALRENRLSFLEDIHYLFARFADLSRIPAR